LLVIPSVIAFVAGFAIPALFGQWLAGRPRGTMDDPRPVPGGARPADDLYVALEQTPIDENVLRAALVDFGVVGVGVRTGVAHVRAVVGRTTANNNPILIKVRRDWKHHWTTIRAEVYHNGRRSWRWIPIASFSTLRSGIREWMDRLGRNGIAALNAGPEAYAAWLYESRTSLREPRAFADVLRRFGA
jgi:hypothetical protein